MAAENIITPSVTNGITIVIMGALGLAGIVLLAQLFHFSLARFGLNAGGQ